MIGPSDFSTAPLDDTILGRAIAGTVPEANQQFRFREWLAAYYDRRDERRTRVREALHG